jgi:hypothetical protein
MDEGNLLPSEQVVLSERVLGGFDASVVAEFLRTIARLMTRCTKYVTAIR